MTLGVKKQKVEGECSALDNLKAAGTRVVADSGDFKAIAKYDPQDSTTNPSLILAASKKSDYQTLIDNAVQYGKQHGTTTDEQVCCAMDKLLVEFGTSILKIVPGMVSTEVDARLSFDKEATIKKALRIIELYKEEGIDKDRVYIKIASTWEGINAAKVLEKEHGIHTNLTLLFSFAQAVACAEARVALVSPFVGRIVDFYTAKTGKQYTSEDNPGIISVKNIYNYYKKHGYKTIVMAASLRTIDEVKALAGLDNMTLPLSVLDKLMDSSESVPTVLTPEIAKREGGEKISYINNESKFRFAMCEDEMATSKLADGIRKFAADAVTLQELLEKKVTA
ncbi:transaldolase KNAG_0D04010 [Huiozyma naganishii CBS 8797]|uniref:Transaldolase n=1 Tax=Huiozyma naganishii (strain ATCC MYA-139 / BCRC 22969 / CBS 8797 / KCTC 17520 / NBRC 10181 / NCYC 3082 / Yp74L-3) TaxID=1071383 RepID=J7RYC6_HUIN7|nr:hypothetical protein KNAG_0D04010 [Kazachstania naganishii CBS 8797]CCK70147.1 hypothetical protein KNAG_0D04010 [Kazachstania naganishii CBS 8797]